MGWRETHVNHRKLFVCVQVKFSVPSPVDMNSSNLKTKILSNNKFLHRDKYYWSLFFPPGFRSNCYILTALIYNIPSQHTFQHLIITNSFHFHSKSRKYQKSRSRSVCDYKLQVGQWAIGVNFLITLNRQQKKTPFKRKQKFPIASRHLVIWYRHSIIWYTNIP